MIFGGELIRQPDAPVRPVLIPLPATLEAVRAVPSVTSDVGINKPSDAERRGRLLCCALQETRRTRQAYRTTKLTDRHERRREPRICKDARHSAHGCSVQRLVMRCRLRARQAPKRTPEKYSPPMRNSPYRLGTPRRPTNNASQYKQSLPHALAYQSATEITRIDPAARGRNVRLAPHNDQAQARRACGSGRQDPRQPALPGAPCSVSHLLKSSSGPL